MPEQQPFVLDPTGADHHAEHHALRDRGAATLVDILGVTAWSVSDPALLKQLLMRADVSKDARAHWRPSPTRSPTGHSRSGWRSTTCSPPTAATTAVCDA